MGRRDQQPLFDPDKVSQKVEDQPRKKKLDVRRFVARLQATSWICGLALVSFTIFCITLCVTRPGSDVVAADFDRQVGYLIWPVPAHFSCFLLNIKSYHLQTDPLKRRFMWLNLYSSACAVASYWLMAEAARFRLVNYDAWGHCFIYFRPIQWIHTTPAMLHQLLLLGDQSTYQIARLHIVNLTMLVLGGVAHMIPSIPAASVLLTLCWLAFAYEMFLVHHIFCVVEDGVASLTYFDVRRGHEASGEVEMARDVEKGFVSFEESKLMEVRMIRHLHFFTIALWFAFGVVDMLHTTAAIPLVLIEHIWGAIDVAAKVLFSSSLTMTGVVSLYEGEKKTAWLAEQRAAAIAEAAAEANRAVLMAQAIAVEQTTEQADRIEELSKLVQEGWAVVVGDMVDTGHLPAGYAGEPVKLLSLASSSSADEEGSMRDKFITSASFTLRSMGLTTDVSAIRQRSRRSSGTLANGVGATPPAGAQSETTSLPAALEGPHEGRDSSASSSDGMPSRD